MTDQALARALSAIAELEGQIKAYLGGDPEPGECAVAILVGRQTSGLRGPLEKWIATRAMLAEQRRQIAT